MKSKIDDNPFVVNAGVLGTTLRKRILLTKLRKKTLGMLGMTDHSRLHHRINQLVAAHPRLAMQLMEAGQTAQDLKNKLVTHCTHAKH